MMESAPVTYLDLERIATILSWLAVGVWFLWMERVWHFGCIVTRLLFKKNSNRRSDDEHKK